MKVAVYGNCQAPIIADFLETLCADIDVVPVQRVHLMSSDRPEAVRLPVGKADVVIHQPIGEGVGPVSSMALRAEFPDKQFVSFPSIYFAGIMPQMLMLRFPVGKEAKPGPLANWHDARFLEAYLNGLSPEEAIEYVQERQLVGCYEKAWNVSASKEKNLDVRVMPLVKELQQEAPCFFMPNHPSNLLLWRVAMEILAVLGMRTAREPEVPAKEALGNYRAAVPNAIAEEIGVKWRRNEYQRNGRDLPMWVLAKKFWELYDSEPALEQICQFNKDRLLMPMRGHAAKAFA